MNVRLASSILGDASKEEGDCRALLNDKRDHDVQGEGEASIRQQHWPQSVNVRPLWHQSQSWSQRTCTCKGAQKQDAQRHHKKNVRDNIELLSSA